MRAAVVDLVVKQDPHQVEVARGMVATASWQNLDPMSTLMQQECGRPVHAEVHTESVCMRPVEVAVTQRRACARQGWVDGDEWRALAAVDIRWGVFTLDP